MVENWSTFAKVMTKKLNAGFLDIVHVVKMDGCS